MTDRELRERLRAQRAQIPDGFDARQDALLMRLTAGGAPARGRMGKRTLALVLAAALLLACGAAAAAGYFGLAGFWHTARPEAEGLIQSGFAQAGGVAAAVEEIIRREHPDFEVKTQRADGLRECRKLLMLAKAGKFDGYLLEGMACPGGCIAGAGTVISSDAAAKKLQQHMSEAEIQSSADSPYADLADQLNEP